MALVFMSNDISAERTGVTINVPNNDAARLMYYLECVCTSINCNDDPDIQRFTKYNNWAYLSIDDQAVLVILCYRFSPDVFDNRVFFQNDALCGDRLNEFYTINQIRNQVLATESIIIAGQVRQVNKIMTYKMAWMKTYYFDPMQRLVARLNRPPPPPAITYTAPTNHQSYYTPPVIRPRANTSKKCSCCCKCCIFIVILIIIGAGVGVYFILRQRGII
jgi:hypothetical protein